MSVRDRHIDKDAKSVIETICVRLVTAVSQTGVVAFKYTPGYPFEILKVSSYNRAKAGAVAGKVKVAAREAVATLAFTNAAEVEQTLADAQASRRGGADEAVSIEYTSDGSGALTDGYVNIQIRPTGLRGD